MNYSLKQWNTFGIDIYAKNIVFAESVQQLLDAWQIAANNHQPVLILGEGSNVLFLEDFLGTVILNRIIGIAITESEEAWHLHVGAGENWHKLVQFTLENSMPGLENLALIPGCAGSSPIQNIGAYGIELKQVCEYVDCIELTGKQQRLNVAECRFGYRDSIFKHEYQERFVIIAVGLRLLKDWQPTLTYGDLNKLNPASVTALEVFDAVCNMRINKLPDPKVNGNVGSFFKNPVVSSETAQELIKKYPNTPHYKQADGSVKLAAGWLIDRCHLKGTGYGGAAVHGLVIINEANATSEDVVKLAHIIRQKVGDKFNVWLEPEVRFIGNCGEVNAVDTIA